MARGQIILTVDEAKKIICKALVKHPVIHHALTEGILVIHPSSTVYHVLTELGVTLPAENEGLWVCGHVRGAGLCLTKPMVDLMMGNYEAQNGTAYPFDLIFKKGVLQPPTPLIDVLNEMGEGDVYLKAVNAIDPQGKLGVLLCVPGGGSIGSVIRNKAKHKYTVFAVAGLEKTIPTSLNEAGRLCRDLDRAMGVKSSLTALKSDYFMTELEALNMLTGCQTVPVSCGGFHGMEGGYIYVLDGATEQLDAAWDLIAAVKEMPDYPPLPVYDCDKCVFKVCMQAKDYDPIIAHEVHRVPLVEQQ